MKKGWPVFLLLCAGCGGPTTEGPISTVDSHTVLASDSTPRILNLDNPHNDTAFSVALDSAGPTISPTDTVKKKQ